RLLWRSVGLGLWCPHLDSNQAASLRRAGGRSTAEGAERTTGLEPASSCLEGRRPASRATSAKIPWGPEPVTHRAGDRNRTRIARLTRTVLTQHEQHRRGDCPES